MDESGKIKFTNSHAKAIENLTAKTTELERVTKQLVEAQENLNTIVRETGSSNEAAIKLQKELIQSYKDSLVALDSQIKKVKKFIQTAGDVSQSKGEFDDLNESISVSSTRTNTLTQSVNQMQRSISAISMDKSLEQFGTLTDIIKNSIFSGTQLGTGISDIVQRLNKLSEAKAAFGIDSGETDLIDKIGAVSAGIANSISDTLDALQRKDLKGQEQALNSLRDRIGFMDSIIRKNDKLIEGSTLLTQRTEGLTSNYKELLTQLIAISDNNTFADMADSIKELQTKASGISFNAAINSTKELLSTLASAVGSTDELRDSASNVAGVIGKLADIKMTLPLGSNEAKFIDEMVVGAQMLANAMNNVLVASMGTAEQQRNANAELTKSFNVYNNLKALNTGILETNNAINDAVIDTSLGMDSIRTATLRIVNSYNDVESSLTNIKKLASDIANTGISVSVSGKPTDGMDKAFSSISKKIKSITVDAAKLSPDTSPADAEKLKFIQKYMTLVSGMTRLQSEMISLDASDIDGKNRITDLLNTQTLQYKSLLESSGSVIHSIKDMPNITSQITKNVKDIERSISATAGLTDKQIQQFKKLTGEAEEFGERIKGAWSMLTGVFKRPLAILGVGFIGAGYAADKLGETVREMGGYLGTVSLQTTGLSFIFKDATQTISALSDEFGGLKDISFDTQLNANLMAANMGISGDEAAKVMGNFARLNGGSADVAVNLADSTKELAKQNGLVPSKIMKEVAGSAEAFALFGKRGGKNIAEAAVAAGKLGVNMDTISGVADHLLDFDSSINDEMELSAMLGKNMNLDYARSLAYQGDLVGATKEVVNQMGGQAAFSKMDYFAKKKAAEMLGTSVENMQKMLENSDKLNKDGTLQLTTFDKWQEALTMFATTGLGSALKIGGSFLVMVGQIGMGLNAFGVGGLIKGFGVLLLNMGLLIAQTTAYLALLASSALFGGGATKVGGALGKAADWMKGKMGESASRMGGVFGKKGEIPTPTAPTVEIPKGVGEKLEPPKSIGEKLKDNATEKIEGKKEDIQQSIEDKVKGTSAEAGESADKLTKSKSIGDKLKDLASGLKAMGEKGVGKGIWNLLGAAGAFVVMTAGVIGLTVVALLGVPAGAGLTALAGGFTALGKVPWPSIVKSAIALVAIGGALYVSSFGFKAFVGVKWEDLGKGVIGLAALAGVAYVLGAATASIMEGALGMVVLGLAMIPFAYGMSLLSGLDIGAVLAAAAGLLIFSAAVFALGALMATGVGAFIFGAGVLAIIALGLALATLGSGLQILGEGLSSISTTLPSMVAQLSTLAQINLLPILGLAGAIGTLAMAMAAFTAVGLLALPVLTGVSAVSSLLGLSTPTAAVGGTATTQTTNQIQGMSDLLNEIKGLRGDLNSGKIAVYMDGKKVTASIASHVDSATSNAYKHT